jgi:hypothetical protein
MKEYNKYYYMPAVKRSSKKHSRRASKGKTGGKKMSKKMSKKHYKLSGGAKRNSKRRVSRKKSKKTIRRKHTGGNLALVTSTPMPVQKPPSANLYPIAENNTVSDLNTHKQAKLLNNTPAIIASANEAIRRANKV